MATLLVCAFVLAALTAAYRLRRYKAHPAYAGQKGFYTRLQLILVAACPVAVLAHVVVSASF